MRNDKDLVQEILKCCEKREDILKKKQPISRYNHYFDNGIQYAERLSLMYINSARYTMSYDIRFSIL